MKSEEENTVIKEEVFELCEKTLNGELCEEGLLRLETLVVGNGQARKFYVEYMHQHAGLYWQHADEGVAFALNSLVSECTIDENRVGSFDQAGKGGADPHASSENIVLGPWTWKKTAAVAVILIGGVLMGWGVAEKNPLEPSIATLIKAANCSWQGGVLPTEEGAKLRTGRLRLQEGLARLKFTSGAELTLEAPVDIELLSPMLCRLHRGTVVAKVPEQAQGFTIETESAKLVDHGTEFGVHVDGHGGRTNVLVFDGIVDVEQKQSGEVQRLTTGNGSKISAEVFETTESAPLELVAGGAGSQSIERSDGGNTMVITTADGQGEDTYVQATDSDIHTSQVLLLAKNSEVFDKGLGYSRKIYLRFDLGRLSPERSVLEAGLRLEVKRSDFGYASFVPDAEFVVYGLRDDHWERDKITWENAPANNDTGGGADVSQVIELGTFVIPQGVYRGEVGVEGPKLVEFLQAESRENGIASLLVVRRTGEIRRGSGLVHAFASKRHPSASPPTLQLKLSD